MNAKRIATLLFILMVTIFAASVTVALAEGLPVTFAWDQDSASLPSLEGWALKVRNDPDGTIISNVPIVYNGETALEFTSEQNIEVFGLPGTTVRKYFNLTSISKNGNESAESNQVFYDFVIPWSDTLAPVNFTITVNIEGN